MVTPPGLAYPAFAVLRVGKVLGHPHNCGGGRI